MRKPLHRHDTVLEEERRKAEFLSEYRVLCEKFRFLAAMDKGQFVVCDWSRNRKAFEEVMQELLLGEVLHISAEGDDEQGQDDSAGGGGN